MLRGVLLARQRRLWAAQQDLKDSSARVIVFSEAVGLRRSRLQQLTKRAQLSKRMRGGLSMGVLKEGLGAVLQDAAELEGGSDALPSARSVGSVGSTGSRTTLVPKEKSKAEALADRKRAVRRMPPVEKRRLLRQFMDIWSSVAMYSKQDKQKLRAVIRKMIQRWLAKSFR